MALGLTPQEIIDSKKHPLLVKASHWERVSLSEVATVQNGYAFKSAYFDRSEGLPLIRIRDVTKTETEHRFKGEYDPAFLVEKGDILIGMDGDFKTAHWKGKTGLLNQRVCRLVPEHDLYDEKFLFICLQPFLNAINAETSSVTVKHLSSKTIQSIPLPLPPLNEQKRIVAKIEELFSELDSGIESLKTAREKLKIYRQAVLKNAFEGNLTRQWREDNKDKLETRDQILKRLRKEQDQNYSAQLERWKKLVETWEAKGREGKKPAKPQRIKEVCSNINLSESSSLPLGWAWVQIENLCNVVRGGSPRPAGDPQYYDGDIPFLKVADITKDDKAYLYSHSYTIKKAGLRKTRKVPPNTLLLSNSGATLGVPKICMIDATFNDGIAAFLGLDTSLLLYHYYYWLSKTRELRAINQGAAQPNLNTDLIKEMPIAICSSEEMLIVANEIEKKLSSIDNVEEEIELQLKKSEILRQSILKQAFSGKLVAQDPADEPASVLLERIKAEKQKASKDKKRKAA